MQRFMDGYEGGSYNLWRWVFTAHRLSLQGQAANGIILTGAIASRTARLFPQFNQNFFSKGTRPLCHCSRLQRS